MKTLHPKIQALKDRTNGEFLTCRYDSPAYPAMQVRAVATEENPWKDDPFVIRGYLAVWNHKDTYGTIARKGCFAKSLAERGPKSNAKNKIIHLFMHDKKEPVGQYLELVEDDYGLRFACKVDDVAGTPLRVLKQTDSGTINQYSYGFRYIWDKMEYNQPLDAVDMWECELWEGSSITCDAAMPETYTIRSKEDLQKVLKDMGSDAEDIIEGLPRQFQMEIRQLVTRYRTLAETKPMTQEKPLLDLSYKPAKSVVVVGGYKLNLNEF